MALVYDDQPYTGPPVSYYRINANRSYLKHYENSLLLHFLLQNGTMDERRQASKELELADRKMKRMEQHANFDWDVVLPEIEKLKKLWRRDALG